MADSGPTPTARLLFGQVPGLNVKTVGPREKWEQWEQWERHPFPSTSLPVRSRHGIT